ncbi:hypothetical protein SAFG77S_08132 [Streptomyces afghaniensis]
MATRAGITSPFTSRSTAADVIAGIDLTGRRAVVTGAASGIGVETARALAGAGAEVTLAVRDTAAGDRTAKDIRATTGSEGVRVAALDLTDPASVRAFTAAWHGPLHILVNNAGVMAAPESRTPQGWELQFATNHLGHFALTTGLHEALTAAGGARVVSVSSSGHLFSPVVFDDLHFTERPYDPWLAYGQSKTANVLFAVEAGRRWAADGITANALMPGGIQTNLGRYMDDARMGLFMTHLRALLGEGTPLPGCPSNRSNRAPRPPSCWPPHPCSTASAAGTSRTATRHRCTSRAPTPGSRRTPWSRRRPSDSGRSPSSSWTDPLPLAGHG